MMEQLRGIGAAEFAQRLGVVAAGIRATQLQRTTQRRAAKIRAAQVVTESAANSLRFCKACRVCRLTPFARAHTGVGGARHPARGTLQPEDQAAALRCGPFSGRCRGPRGRGPPGRGTGAAGRPAGRFGVVCGVLVLEEAHCKGAQHLCVDQQARVERLLERN